MRQRLAAGPYETMNGLINHPAFPQPNVKTGIKILGILSVAGCKVPPEIIGFVHLLFTNLG
jgi:hypothetical protein